MDSFKSAYPDEWKEIVKPAGSGSGARVHVDLWEANRRQLAAAGLGETRIEVSGMCTSCRTDLFYSHRKEAPTAEGGQSGRFAGVIMLNGRTNRSY